MNTSIARIGEQIGAQIDARNVARSVALIFAVLFATATADQNWQLSRMPWGDPDLQGTWTNATMTGLERWKGFDALVIEEALAAQLEAREAGFSEEIDTFAAGDLPSGIMVGGYNSAWLDPGTRLLRINGEARSSIIVEPADGHVPYNVRGFVTMWLNLIRSQKRNNPEEQLVGDRCVAGFGATGGPPMLPVLYNNNYQIVQTPGRVTILVEMNHSIRSIRLRSSQGGEQDVKPLPDPIRPWLGDAIGHWEGDTLVVESTHFHPQQGLGTAIKHKLFVGKDSLVTERFTRTGADEIHYGFTVEDPHIYRQPWRGELAFRPSNGEIYEYACHEGNYGMVNMLAGERARGVNGLRWWWRLITRTPEEFSHPQLSGARFDR